MAASMAGGLARALLKLAAVVTMTARGSSWGSGVVVLAAPCGCNGARLNVRLRPCNSRIESQCHARLTQRWTHAAPPAGGYQIRDADCLDDILCTQCQPCDVPCCTRAAHWAELTAAAPWAARDGHAVLSAEISNHDGGNASSTVFVMGGRVRDGNGSTTLLNDVWETRNGTAWVQHTFQADGIWSPRAFFGAAASDKFRLFVMGGVAMDPSANSGTVALNDVWLWRRASTSSEPASSGWRRLTAAAPWSARARFGAGWLPSFPLADASHNGGLASNGILYVLGGQRPPQHAAVAEGNASGAVWEIEVLSDVWVSHDGTNWSCTARYAPWAASPPESGVGATGGSLVGAGERLGFAALTHGTDTSQPPYIIVMGGLRRFQLPPPAGQADHCTDGQRAGSVGSGVGAVPPAGARSEAQGEEPQLLWQATRDIWRSYDGAVWEAVQLCADWGSRYDFGAVSDGRQLVVVGGFAVVDEGRGREAYGDVWQSARHCHADLPCNEAGNEWLPIVSPGSTSKWVERGLVQLARLKGTILAVGGAKLSLPTLSTPTSTPLPTPPLSEGDLFGNVFGGSVGTGRDMSIQPLNDVHTTQQRCRKGHVGPACVPCAEGSYSEPEGWLPRVECITCPAGKFSGPGASSCQPCPAGNEYSFLLVFEATFTRAAAVKYSAEQALAARCFTLPVKQYASCTSLSRSNVM